MFDGLALPGSRAASSRLVLDDLNPINRGLVGFWPLNHGGGTVARDLSAYKRNGTLTNFGTSATSGWGVSPLGRVLNFDGANDYIPVNNVPDMPYVTISAWVKAVGGNQGFIVNKNYSGGVVPFSLSVAPNGTFGGFAFFSGGWWCSNVTTDIRNDGKWHLIVGSYDGATMRYYVDRKLDSSASVSGTLPSNTHPVDIGGYRNDGAYFNGTMCAVRIHSRALAHSEIIRLYHDPWAGTSAAEAPLFFVGRPAAGGTPATANPGPATLTLAGTTPTPTAAASVTAGAAAIALAGRTATATAAATASPGAAAVALAGRTATATAAAVVTAGAAALALAGRTATATGAALASPGAAALALAGATPTPTAAATVTPGAAALLLAGLGVSAGATTAATATPGPATLVLSGAAVSATAGAEVSPGAASLTLAGLLASVSAAALVTPGAAALALAGRGVNQAVAVVPASRRIALPARDRLTSLATRDRLVALPARNRITTLAPERD